MSGSFWQAAVPLALSLPLHTSCQALRTFLDASSTLSVVFSVVSCVCDYSISVDYSISIDYSISLDFFRRFARLFHFDRITWFDRNRYIPSSLGVCLFLLSPSYDGPSPKNREEKRSTKKCSSSTGGTLFGSREFATGRQGSRKQTYEKETRQCSGGGSGSGGGGGGGSGGGHSSCFYRRESPKQCVCECAGNV